MATVGNQYVPQEIWALLSCMLGKGEEGDMTRKLAGNISVKTETVTRQGNKTYKNGLLHSFGDDPAYVWITSRGDRWEEWWFEGERISRVETYPNGSKYYYNADGGLTDIVLSVAANDEESDGNNADEDEEEESDGNNADEDEEESDGNNADEDD